MTFVDNGTVKRDSESANGKENNMDYLIKFVQINWLWGHTE